MMRFNVPRLRAVHGYKFTGPPAQRTDEADQCRRLRAVHGYKFAGPPAQRTDEAD